MRTQRDFSATIPVIAGPTASGKTAVAMELAELLGGEIINADSCQVYAGLVVGTAAPTAQEQARARHHCVGAVSPETVMSAGDYAKAARVAHRDIVSRGLRPIVCGGSGLYIRAFAEGLFEGPGQNEALREALRLEAEEVGSEVLYRRLREADPEYAAVIHENDVLRITRALEVWQSTGKTFTWWHRQRPPQEEALPVRHFGLEWPREALYERINRRAAQMFDGGIQAETEAALAAGIPESAHAFQGHGYEEVLKLRRGEMTLDEAIASTAQRSRRYAKRQLTWFRKLPDMRWLAMDESREARQVAEEILALLREG